MDITFSDEIQSNVSANISLNESNLTETAQTDQIDKSYSSRADDKGLDKTLSPSLVINVENIDPGKSDNVSPSIEAQEIFTPAVPKDESPNVDGAWGSHLNKDKVTPNPSSKKNLLVGRSSSFQLSKKMFSSTNFNKRNPRKSLSLKLKSNKSSLNLTVSTTETTSGETMDVEAPKSLFGETVKIVQTEAKVLAQPTNAIHQLIRGQPLGNRILNAGWLERCSRENNLEPISYDPQRLSGDSGIGNMDCSDPTTSESLNIPVAEKSKEFSDEEDFICNSDSEEERRNKRVRNLKKRLSDGVEQMTKRSCFETDNFSPCQPELNNFVATSPCPVIQEVEVKKPIVAEKPDTKSNEEYKPDSENDEESTEEVTPKKKKTTRKTTRVTRTTRSKTKASGTVAKKTAAVTKRVTRKRSQKLEELPEEEISTDPQIPIYGIEATEVIPRFALPTNVTGDLVSDFSKSVASDTTITGKATAVKSKGPLTDREKLEQKVAAGKLNENFVRINIKKKVFVRGKKNFNFSKYKKNQWKQRKKELSSGEAALDIADFVEKTGANTCFKCGGTGHYSRRCPAMKSEELLPIDEAIQTASTFPTLEEVEKMASQNAIIAHGARIDRLPKCPSKKFEAPSGLKEMREGENEENEDCDKFFEDGDFDEELESEHLEVVPRKLQGHKIPEELLAKLLPPETGAIEPIYSNPSETSVEVAEALKMFGHEAFRPGQEKAVMRILSGQSTLVTLSTGSGKSLCYQLPAYIYAKHSKCITLVVSPLVSLMDDQVVGVPKFLSAAALHTGQNAKVKAKIMQTIKEGKLDILLVSSEAIVAGEKSTGFGALLRQLPPIAFACIDEAHCISQWSHNFRPSYLMICRVLMDKLGVKTILGLTATATKSTAESIVKHLKIRDGMAGVISDTPMPKNLNLTVSKDEQRDRALIELLLSERFKECDSIIVYCTRREECTRIAGVLRVSLQVSV